MINVFSVLKEDLGISYEVITCNDDVDPFYLLTENGTIILNENGNKLILENGG